MSAAAVARETGARLAAAETAGLNATLHWSREGLDAEARRVDATEISGAPDEGGTVIYFSRDDRFTVTQTPTEVAAKLREREE